MRSSLISNSFCLRTGSRDQLYEELDVDVEEATPGDGHEKIAHSLG